MNGIERPSVPEVIERFRAYKRFNPAWGSLHIVLDDGNFQNHHALWCVGHAKECDDGEGEALARLLVDMSRTQRRRIAILANRSAGT